MSAQIVAFPQVRRVGAIRRAARYLKSLRSNDAREKWLNARLLQIEAGLDQAGVRECVVDREVVAFAYAVAREMRAPMQERADG